jgi:superfamily I DNA and/or RNA helicase
MSISLFERMAKAGVTAHMLDTQHRMHPAIAAFPSRFFYGGRLRTAQTLSSANRPAPPGFDWPNRFCPVAFVAARQGVEHRSGLSYANQGEAQLLGRIIADVSMAVAQTGVSLKHCPDFNRNRAENYPCFVRI